MSRKGEIFAIVGLAFASGCSAVGSLVVLLGNLPNMNAGDQFPLLTLGLMLVSALLVNVSYRKAEKLLGLA